MTSRRQAYIASQRRSYRAAISAEAKPAHAEMMEALREFLRALNKLGGIPSVRSVHARVLGDAYRQAISMQHDLGMLLAGQAASFRASVAPGDASKRAAQKISDALRKSLQDMAELEDLVEDDDPDMEYREVINDVAEAADHVERAMALLPK